MKNVKGFCVSTLLVVSLFGANAANAGIPVIDAANLAQSIQQVLAWVEQQIQMATQIQNQTTQIQHQVQHIQDITGSRNLGEVFNNPLLQQVIPANVQTVMSAVNTNGYNGMTGQAQGIRTSTMLYNCLDKPPGGIRTSCQAVLSGASQAQAYQTNALATVQQRVTEIQNMQNQINQTQDPKAISEVQAALAAEQAQVANDAIRVAVANQMVENQRLAAEQALREREIAKMSAATTETANGYVFP